MSSNASRCIDSTLRVDSAFLWYPPNGPSSSASSTDVAYAVPVINAVTAAAHDLPSSESYGSPRAMSAAPRFA